MLLDDIYLVTAASGQNKYVFLIKLSQPANFFAIAATLLYIFVLKQYKSQNLRSFHIRIRVNQKVIALLYAEKVTKTSRSPKISSRLLLPPNWH